MYLKQAKRTLNVLYFFFTHSHLLKSLPDNLLLIKLTDPK